MVHYFDVATSSSPSASGYGGNGASGGIGDASVRIVNASATAPQQRGTLCAMIYAFDDIEEMQACCGCPVTPDGLRTMSVINNITSNFGVNHGNLNAGVIEIVASQPNFFTSIEVPLPAQIGPLGFSGWACDPSNRFFSAADVNGLMNPVNGLEAWEAHAESNVAVPANGSRVRGVSVNEFQYAQLDVPHLNVLENICAFLIANGSGTGSCSCGAGDDFSQVGFPLK